MAEMRERNWQLRKVAEMIGAPKTLKQIHREAANEEQERKIYLYSTLMNAMPIFTFPLYGSRH